MTHRFPIKEIARQAGLGTATVDRVLNGRAHVSPQTRARVEAALAELKMQERQLSARGRRLFVDVVLGAPQRFTRQVRAACEATLPELPEAVFRPRFLFQEIMREAEIVAILERIRRRGSQGVVVTARDVPVVRDKVGELEAAGIPVVTLATDISCPERTAYVGIDNARAGQTAAYLLAQVLGERRSTILTSRRREEFQGEAERYLEFRKAFLQARPGDEIVEITGGGGLSRDTRRRLETELFHIPAVDAVFSIGGGNRAIVEVLRDADRAPGCFIAHDLDAENVGLLRSGQINFVLHHDLQSSMYQAFRALSAKHGLVPPSDATGLSDIQVVTPHNIPIARER